MVEDFENEFESPFLERKFAYRAFAPKGFKNEVRTLPVLYLLHGLFGEMGNWAQLTKIKSYLKSNNFVVVMPNAGDYWYTDSAVNKKARFETFFVNEFFNAVEKELNIGKCRAQRAIAGISMGGYGAIKFGLKNPEYFCFIGSMSGALNAPAICEKNIKKGQEELLPSLRFAFGNASEIGNTQNNLFEIVRNLSDQERKTLPNIYLDCGTKDSFLIDNIRFFELLRDKKISAEFEIVNGSHDWGYWNKRLEIVLTKAKQVFENDKH
ncbi:MAG: alpha/beta hydrolase [Pyrinomonadaceae bacterium]